MKTEFQIEIAEGHIFSTDELKAAYEKLEKLQLLYSYFEQLNHTPSSTLILGGTGGKHLKLEATELSEFLTAYASKLKKELKQAGVYINTVTERSVDTPARPE